VARSRVTSKGQVTIPASARLAAGLEPGDQVLFVVEGERITLVPVKSRKLTDLAGALATSDAAPVADYAQARAAAGHALGEAMAEENRDWCEPT
jgi:antitoxin PrlF